MASRILYNNGLEIDQAISGAYQNIIERGSGFIRDTGVQVISGQKFFYDTVTFYSGLNLSGDLSLGGKIIGNLLPKTANSYDLGAYGQEWKSLYLSGNSSVEGNSDVTGNMAVGGTTSLYGDFIPANIATSLLPKTTNLYDLGSNAKQFANLWINGTGRINSLHVNGNSSVSGSETVVGQFSAGSISTTGGYGNISGSNLITTGNASLGVTSVVSLASAGSVSSTSSGVYRLLYVTGSGIPATATSAGSFGQIVLGSGFLFACTGTNAWGRIPLSGGW